MQAVKKVKYWYIMNCYDGKHLVTNKFMFWCDNNSCLDCKILKARTHQFKTEQERLIFVSGRVLVLIGENDI